MTYLALDVGGTKIAGARVSDAGDLIGGVHVRSTPAREGGAAVLGAMLDVLRECGLKGVDGVGVGTAGVIDSSSGRVLSATSHITGWAGTDVADAIEGATGLPTFVLNDGHAFALGELLYGAGRGVESLLLMVAGTGVGGAFVAGGVPLFGAHWTAGHFGHVAVPQAVGVDCYCGGSGHLEAVGGGAGMLALYRRNGGEAAVASTKELFERLPHDVVARDSIALGAEAFGLATGSLVNAFDPGVVVVAGGLAQAGPVWERPMREAYTGALMPGLTHTPLVLSAMTNWYSLRGAAAYTRSQRGHR